MSAAERLVPVQGSRFHGTNCSWLMNDSRLQADMIWSLLLDSKGNRWIGTGFDGLSDYREDGVRW
jgi:hypothetical protein